MDIIITLTDTEYKGLQYAAIDPNNWIENAAKVRAKVANDEIINLLISHCNANGVAIASGLDAQIIQAYDLGLVESAVERQARLEAELAARG